MLKFGAYVEEVKRLSKAKRYDDGGGYRLVLQVGEKDKLAMDALFAGKEETTFAVGMQEYEEDDA